MWNPVIRQAILAGYLRKDVESYGLLKLTASGRRFMKSPGEFMIVLDRDFSDSYSDSSDGHEGGTSALDPQALRHAEGAAL